MRTSSMSACGCGERRSRACSMRGSTMSSAKRVCPATLARPSTRRRGLPMTFMFHPPCSLFDGFENLLVAGAAAKVPRDRLANPFARGRLLALEECLGRHQDAGSAVAALRRAEVGESRLQRVELGAASEALDRVD